MDPKEAVGVAAGEGAADEARRARREEAKRRVSVVLVSLNGVRRQGKGEPEENYEQAIMQHGDHRDDLDVGYLTERYAPRVLARALAAQLGQRGKEPVLAKNLVPLGPRFSATVDFSEPGFGDPEPPGTGAAPDYPDE